MGRSPKLVYVEDTTGLNPLATTYAIATPTAPVTTTLSLRMRLMSPGVDYSIDRIRGIPTFVNPVSPDVRIAIDFTRWRTARVLSSLIAGHTALMFKDHNPETPQVSQEIKRFYSLGDKNIVRDNGLGNFAFRVFGQKRANRHRQHAQSDPKISRYDHYAVRNRYFRVGEPASV